MPLDFAGLVTYFGVPGAMLAVALGIMVRAYRQALADKDAAHAQTLAEKDATIDALEDRATKLEDRLFRVLDKADRVADLAGAPPAPPVRRRRSEV